MDLKPGSLVFSLSHLDEKIPPYTIGVVMATPLYRKHKDFEMVVEVDFGNINYIVMNWEVLPVEYIKSEIKCLKL